LDVEETCAEGPNILDAGGHAAGKLFYKMDPGDEIMDREDGAEEMSAIINEKVDLTIGITEATDLPKPYENIYAMYNMGFIGGGQIKAPAQPGMTNRPQFNHE